MDIKYKYSIQGKFICKKNIENFESSYNHYNRKNLTKWLSIFPYHMYHTCFMTNELKKN